MSAYHEITLTGQLTVGRDVLICLNCRAVTGLTVCGTIGRPNTVMITCPNGHTARPPRPLDRVDLIRVIVTSPSYRNTGRI